MSAGKFVCVGKKCDVVRRTLLRWGWTENTDPNSTDFDLKWSTCRKAVDGLVLPQTQFVNHLRGSGCLHNKASMAAALNQCSKCSQTFFPRQYDLQSPLQVRKFLEDYVITQAELCLKNDPDHVVATRVLKRAGENLGPLVQCAHEWAALAGSELQLPLELESSMRSFAKAYSQSKSNPNCPICEGAEVDPMSLSFSSSSPNVTTKCTEQASLDGPANAWVVKNPSLSKAKGVKVLMGLRHILAESEKAYMKSHGHCVVQKYIERPLRLRRNGREAKTDLRLWVLVLSFNPLTAFVYSDVYFRVATSDFTLEPGDKVEQRAHVTNNRSTDNRLSSEALFKELGPENEKLWKQRTWPLMLDSVRATLLATQSKVLARGQDLLLQAANQAQVERGTSGPNAFELFGFDFVVDEDFRPWMLEANVSPDMLSECDIDQLQGWSEKAIEGLLGIVLAHRGKTLNIPKIQELQAWGTNAGSSRSIVNAMQEQSAGTTKSSDELVVSERLFGRDEDGGDFQAHDSNLCYGSIVSKIPECLVRGLDLGPPCNGWLLFLREKSLEESKTRSNWMQHAAASFSLEGSEEFNRLQVLREILLPVPRRLQPLQANDAPPVLQRPSSMRPSSMHRKSSKPCRLPSLSIVSSSLSNPKCCEKSDVKDVNKSGIIYPHCVTYEAYVEDEGEDVPSKRLSDLKRSAQKQLQYQQRMAKQRWSNITKLPGVAMALSQLDQPFERRAEVVKGSMKATESPKERFSRGAWTKVQDSWLAAVPS